VDAHEAYKQGFIDGMKAYAWWNDGHEEVGTTGTTLKKAVEDVEKTWNYNPPPKNPNKYCTCQCDEDADACLVHGDK